MEEHTVPINDPRTWLSVIDCAKYLGVGSSTVMSWTYKKVIPAYKVGIQWRYNRTEIDNWVVSGNAAFESMTHHSS